MTNVLYISEKEAILINVTTNVVKKIQTFQAENFDEMHFKKFILKYSFLSLLLDLPEYSEKHQFSINIPLKSNFSMIEKKLIQGKSLFINILSIFKNNLKNITISRYIQSSSSFVNVIQNILENNMFCIVNIFSIYDLLNINQNAKKKNDNKTFINLLIDENFSIISGTYDNHLFLIRDLKSEKNLQTEEELAKNLYVVLRYLYTTFTELTNNINIQIYTKSKIDETKIQKSQEIFETIPINQILLTEKNPYLNQEDFHFGIMRLLFEKINKSNVSKKVFKNNIFKFNNAFLIIKYFAIIISMFVIIFFGFALFFNIEKNKQLKISNYTVSQQIKDIDRKIKNMENDFTDNGNTNLLFAKMLLSDKDENYNHYEKILFINELFKKYKKDFHFIKYEYSLNDNLLSYNFKFYIVSQNHELFLNEIKEYLENLKNKNEILRYNIVNEKKFNLNNNISYPLINLEIMKNK